MEAQMTGTARVSRVLAVVPAALAFVWAGQACADPAKPGRVEFEVLRGGEHFGNQSVTVTASDGAFAVKTAASLKATIGPITVFSYKQQCDEAWRGAALAGLKCSTVRDGKTTIVESTHSTSGIKVSGEKKKVSDFSAEAWPSTWWTKPKLGSYDLINTETGKPMPVSVTHLGKDTRRVAGQQIQADHIRVAGTLTVDLWYDDAGRWVDCAFSASGQKMTYRLLSPISDAPA
jgi:hypothetical protein